MRAPVRDRLHALVALMRGGKLETDGYDVMYDFTNNLLISFSAYAHERAS